MYSKSTHFLIWLDVMFSGWSNLFRYLSPALKIEVGQTNKDDLLDPLNQVQKVGIRKMFLGLTSKIHRPRKVRFSIARGEIGPSWGIPGLLSKLELSAKGLLKNGRRFVCVDSHGMYHEQKSHPIVVSEYNNETVYEGEFDVGKELLSRLNIERNLYIEKLTQKLAFAWPDTYIELRLTRCSQDFPHPSRPD